MIKVQVFDQMVKSETSKIATSVSSLQECFRAWGLGRRIWVFLGVLGLANFLVRSARANIDTFALCRPQNVGREMS